MYGSPIISMNNLAVGYRNRKVLSHLNLKIMPGELICFMGPNGAGKSTLIKTLCQFQPSLEGRILIKDQPMQDWSRKDLARLMSVVLTDSLNAGQLTGKELVAAGRYPYTSWAGKLQSEDWEKVEDAMIKTGTQSLATVPFYEMSDGQKQKIMITRALCQETPLILLDEPTAHLDLNNRVAIVTLLRELAHKEQRAVLMATHELDLALQMADTLWLAETGGTVVTGIPEDLVLDGSIDRVFEFKGYDLKTGSVHPLRSGRQVALVGEGFLYLWTKNALERNGYEIVSEDAPLVSVMLRDEERIWEFNNSTYNSVRDMLYALENHF